MRVTLPRCAVVGHDVLADYGWMHLGDRDEETTSDFRVSQTASLLLEVVRSVIATSIRCQGSRSTLTRIQQQPVTHAPRRRGIRFISAPSRPASHRAVAITDLR